MGQQGHQVGFGIREADFFLCQETPGIKTGAAHIAFTATSRTAVRDFYSAALTAGGRPNGSPACRTGDDSHFNAAVLDFDGNSIEVVYSGAPDYRDDGTVISHSRVITWERTVSQSMRDDASVISSRTARSVAKAPTEVSKAPSVASKAPSVVSQAPSVARSISEPAVVPQAAPPAASKSGDAATTLVGTLLGAAAGAAVAYAFVRSERDSAKKEEDFSAFMEAKNTVKAAVGQLAQASPPPQPPQQDPPPAYEPAPSVARSVASVHRNDDAGSVVSASPSRASQVPTGQKPSRFILMPRGTARTRDIQVVAAKKKRGLHRRRRQPRRPPSKKPSKAASVISSIFSRDKDKKSSADSDFIDDLDIEELTEDDYETVVPSDSISQAGSSRRTHRRKHRSRTDELKEEAGTTVSKSSHRSHRSHRSHKSRSHHDDSDSDHSTESRRRHRSSRPTIVSEPSDASTIKPVKSSSRDKERRKDSLTEGSKYDAMFDQVQYGHGSVPVRGITPSMINASTNNKNRSVISFAMGQKMKAFEG
ncbi:hypothetical protein N0V86_000378 [Didymella sp. IMI 355093]|nr:hypothetical protein N0V86_000378 [Didymella sp. IMI 355093]